MGIKKSKINIKLPKFGNLIKSEYVKPSVYTPEQKTELKYHISEWFTEKRKTIPDQYNKAEAIDTLLNEGVDLVFSISNRGDGKTEQYFDFSFDLAYVFNIPFLALVRRKHSVASVVGTLKRIIKRREDLDMELLKEVKNSPRFLTVEYDGKLICHVADINSASNLKNESPWLEVCEFMVYDECLAYEEDAILNEGSKFKNIWDTINRGQRDEDGNIVSKFFGRPPMILLANPTSQSSELLAEFDLYDKLAYHEEHYFNSYAKYTGKNKGSYTVLEMRMNEASNANKITGPWSNDGSMRTGKFELNAHAVKPLKNNMNFNDFYIKINDTKTIKVRFSKVVSDKSIHLEVINGNNMESYCMEIKDKTDKCKYLELDKFYDEKHIKKHNKDRYTFENAFSKSYILDNYYHLRIDKIVRKFKASLTAQQDLQALYNSTYKMSQYEQEIFNKIMSCYI